LETRRLLERSLPIGGFVVSGSQPVFDHQFHVTLKFMHVSDTRIDGSVITESRIGNRLTDTNRYSGTAIRQ